MIDKEKNANPLCKEIINPARRSRTNKAELYRRLTLMQGYSSMQAALSCSFEELCEVMGRLEEKERYKAQILLINGLVVFANQKKEVAEGEPFKKMVQAQRELAECKEELRAVKITLEMLILDKYKNMPKC